MRAGSGQTTRLSAVAEAVVAVVGHYSVQTLQTLKVEWMHLLESSRKFFCSLIRALE